MNDLNPTSEKRESVFKVYKDKLKAFANPKPKTAPENPAAPASPSSIPKTPSAVPNTPPAASPPISDEQAPKMVFRIPSIFYKGLAIVIATLLLGYGIVNYHALALKINYWYNVDIKHLKWSELHPVTLKKPVSTAQKLEENYLYIPTLGIEAPVQWGAEEQDANSLMSSGLVHYAASALPDDALGNIFITGSTSSPIWNQSDYKTIFTLLNKITNNSVITIIYKNNIYSYTIDSTDSLGNSQVVIAPGVDETQSYLNLLARYPVGINWRTFLVRAKLTNIESNIAKSIDDKINELPSTSGDIELKPIEVSPTPTTIPIPTDNKIPSPDILPDHFLPST